MQAEKIYLETDQHGRLLNVPALPPNVKLEAIFLVLDRLPQTKRRKPSPLIAGKGKLTGDIMAPAAAENEWDALQ
ncbi:MAG: hypothetical protein LUQ11_07730 [Methylococcaceae bacterium]|nr:hypothetical protein [Methylococcaceae bacterium]